MINHYVQKQLGRRLRLGVVGGGAASFIGNVHRAAALMNEQYDVVASVLSSDPERSLQTARDLGIARGYATAKDMIETESSLAEGIDVIAIMTPNNSHYEIACLALDHGLHVICEKPLTNHLPEALDLQRRVRESNLQFCVAYCYSAYPMIRQAKAMVDAGDLGDIRMVQCHYVQGHLAQLTDSEKDGTNWHMKKEIAGDDLIVGDIGTHCYHLSHFVSGMMPEQLSADTCTLVPGRTATDYTSIQLRYANGARGHLWVTQAAAGAEHGLYLRVFGDKGGIEWHQEQPNELRHRRLEKPAQILSKGGPGLHEAAYRASRVSFGHPEGYREAFATLYADFAEAVVDSKLAQGANHPPLFPQIEDGVEGVKFVQNAITSSHDNAAWIAID